MINNYTILNYLQEQHILIKKSKYKNKSISELYIFNIFLLKRATIA